LFFASGSRRLSEFSKIVLLAVLEYGEFPAVLRIANLVRDRMKLDVAIFFAKAHYRRLAEDTAEVVSQGHVWVDQNGVSHVTPAELSPPDQEAPAYVPTIVAPVLRQERRAVLPIIAIIGVIFGAVLATAIAGWRGAIRSIRAAGVDVLNLVADTRRFRERARRIDELLGRIRPCLVIVPQAPVGTDLSFLLRAARSHNVPTIFAPFAIFNVRGLAEFAYASSAHRIDGRPLNRVLAALFPHWVATFHGEMLLRLPGSRGLALELAGLVGANPWLPCAEPVTAIACDSRVSKRGFEQLGMTDRIETVGAPVHDRLAEHLARGIAGRDALMRRFGLDSARPLLVCGWPANIFEWAKGRGAAYSDYASLARAWGSALERMRKVHGVEVLVSVHPKTLDHEFREATNQGLTVVRGDSDALVAYCDMFTTLNGSSLTAWAIACNRPIVLFDCFRTGYTDFEDVPGCITVSDEEAFVAELDRLCGDARARAELSDAQRPVAADWAHLDGCSSARFAALAAELVSIPLDTNCTRLDSDSKL